MPLPTLVELDSEGGSFDNSSEGGALPQTGPKKSVRFAADPSNAGEEAAHRAGLAAHPISPVRDDGGGSGAASPDGSGDHSQAAGGEAASEASAADNARQSDCNDAVDAKGHGMLPSWRMQFKMPYVQWCAPQAPANTLPTLSQHTSQRSGTDPSPEVALVATQVQRHRYRHLARCVICRPGVRGNPRRQVTDLQSCING